MLIVLSTYFVTTEALMYRPIPIVNSIFGHPIDTVLSII